MLYVRVTGERKFLWVKDGHENPEPEWSIFAGVVSKESIPIPLTHVVLNYVVI